MSNITQPLSNKKQALVRITNYWLCDLDDPGSYSEKRYQDLEHPETTVEVVSTRGTISKTYPTAFLKAVRMEGSGKTKDGVLTGDSHRWYLMDPIKYPYGRCASGALAVPFYSIAVDPTLIPLRTVCYIPRLVGFKYPVGISDAIHDGYVRADDTGGAIKGCHIDLHVGFKKWRIDNQISPDELIEIQWEGKDEPVKSA